ncbi:NACHT and WD domain-containing protein [Paramyrothecium foliicola]|nr:NACHT and WD domain-containing protein [Paramyrothecium foliicola]
MLAKFRISTFGYNAKYRGASTNLDIIDFAKDLLLQLLTTFDSASRGLARPIIFIVHSLGGLVVKKAMSLGKHDQQYSDLVERFRGIIFLATPHRGSQYAKTLNNVLAATPLGSSPKAYVAGLDMQSAAIQDINESFRQHCEGLLLCSFYETLKTSLGITKALIVEKDSAILGYPNEISAAMHADHQTICKYRDRIDPNFMKLKGVLKTWALQLVPESTEPKTISDPISQHEVEERLEKILGVGHPGIEDGVSITSRGATRAAPGKWLFETKEFQYWINQLPDQPSSRHFWLVGLPGTGKSVLARSVVELCRSQGYDVQYHFFNRTHQMKRTAAYCLRSIASQLALSSPQFREALFSFHEKTGLSFHGQNQGLQTIWDRVFQSILFQLSLTSPIVWVLDGIDESDNATVLLARMLAMQTRTVIKIIFTSTPLKAVPAASQPHLTTYFLSTRDTSQDMLDYVTQTVRSALPDDGAVQELVRREILRKASGSFLWAKLALEMVQDRWHTVDDIEAALNEVPKGMVAMYSRMLTTIQEQAQRNCELAKRVLTWVVCSWRPLFIDELADALQAEFGTFTNLELTIAQICGHFITIDRTSDIGRPRACLIHTTARDFLVQKQGEDEPWVVVKQAHEQMAIICLNYLCDERWRRLFSNLAASPATGDNSDCDVQKANRLRIASKSFALLEYATYHWAYHVSKSPTYSPRLMEVLENFMLNYCLSWIEAIALSGNMAHLIRSAKYLKAYVKRDTRSFHANTLSRITIPGSPVPSTAVPLSWIQPWARDFIRIAGKFASNLIARPSSIHRNVPPMCPRQSMIGVTFASTARPGALSVRGLSSLAWDDCLASVEGAGPGEIATQVLVTESFFFTLASSAGYVAVWNAETCEKARILRHGEYLSMMAVNKIGTLVAANSFKNICVWDTSSGNLIHKIPKLGDALVRDMMFGNNETQLAVAYDSCALQCMDAQSGLVERISQADLSNFHAGYQGCPWRQAISHDLTRVAMAWRGRTPLVWDLQALSPRPTICRARGPADSLLYPEGLVWHPDTADLLILCQDTSLVMWRLADDELVDFPQVRARDIALSKDGSLLLTADSSGTLSIWTFPHLHLIYSLSNTDDPSTGMALSPDNQRFYDVRGSICNVWEPEALVRSDDADLETSSATGSYAPSEAVLASAATNGAPITTIAAGPQDKHFACGREGGIVSIHSAIDGQRERKVYTHPAADEVTILCWSPSGKYIVSCDESTLLVAKRLQLKDDGKWAVFAAFELRLGEPVLQILFSMDEKMVLISTPTKDRVWDFRAKKEAYARMRVGNQQGRWVLRPELPSELWLINATNGVVAYEWSTGQISQKIDAFDEISLYDIVHVPGIATDLNHIDTRAKVSGYLPENDGLKKALKGADIVVVTAGIARKPGMTRDDLFKTNTSIIHDIFAEVATTCPQAISCIVTNPVNSTVPVAAEALRIAGVFDPTRLFGVTTLDVVRASTFIAHTLGGDADPKHFKIPVIGGHSGATILPLYSQSVPKVNVDDETLAGVVHRIQFGGDEIVQSKKGAGSATTCMAYAGFRFIKALLAAKSLGVPGGKEIAAKLGVDYFAVKIELGPSGAMKALDIGELSLNEQKLLDTAIGELKVNIKSGRDFTPK